MMSSRRHPHKKRRVRKKWKVGEFMIYGFGVTGTAPFTNSFLDQTIQFAESHGFGMGGGQNVMRGEFSFFVTGWGEKKMDRSLTSVDRDLVAAWFMSKPGVSNVVVSKLVDAWS